MKFLSIATTVDIMSVLRNSAACLLRKALRSFQHVAPVVREVQGNWRGCSNQSNGNFWISVTAAAISVENRVVIMALSKG